MRAGDSIYLAGHRGLVGSALNRALRHSGYTNILTRSSAELDLRRRADVFEFFDSNRPQFVMLAAAKVGGIQANNMYPADFIRDNLDIEMNVIEACHRTGVKRMLFLGSSCIYPQMCPQPIREEYLLTGPLEKTNRPYALAKIAGIELCWSYNRQYGTRFLAAMPSNLYGPGDNYDLETSHVLPALIRKVMTAMREGSSSVTVWGTGAPLREFLHSDDLAAACLLLMNLDEEAYGALCSEDHPPLINVGRGEDVSIRELAGIVCKVLGYRGELVFDTTKPDGTPRKLMDSSRMQALGWAPQIELEEGIRRTVAERPVGVPS